MINPRSIIVSMALLAAVAAPAHSQSGSGSGGGSGSGSGPSCGGRQAVGYIGISGIDCNCTISSPGSGKSWAFRTEPKITSLEMDSRAGKVLKVGDVITHVNGKLITTRDGAQELATIKPGEAVVLNIRRNGQAMRFAITADGTCPTDSRLLGIYAPGRPMGKAPSAKVWGEMPPVEAPRATAAPRTQPGVPKATPAPGVYTVQPARASYNTMPRASFGMGLSCSGECTIQFSEKEHTALMSFSQPPEIYSIERGGPADKAGIQRGDVLTHINGSAMDTPEGGRIFASVKPGETVRLTIRRGTERKTVSLRAAQRATPMPDLVESSASLLKARESLTALQREQNEQLRKIQEDLRRSQEMSEVQMRELTRELLRTERQHSSKLKELERELLRADGGMKAAADSARSACAVPMLAPTPAARLSRTLRYSGTLGDSDIEVRGSSPVSVTENRDEVVITTGGTVVRVKKSNN